MDFRDLVANAEIDDSLFELPTGVDFEQANTRELANISGKEKETDRSASKDNQDADSAQLFCIFDVVKFRINGDRKQVGGRLKYSFLLDPDGYVVYERPMAEIAEGFSEIFHRPTEELISINHSAKAYYANSAVSMAHFRVQELNHRNATCHALEAMGLPKVYACTRLELESAMGVAVPQFFKQTGGLKFGETIEEGEYQFSYDGKPFCRFTPSETELTDEQSNSLRNLLAHTVLLHPNVRKRMVATKKLPKSFAIRIKEYQRDGNFDHFEIVYTLKLAKAKKSPDWSKVPSGYKQVDINLVNDVVEIVGLFEKQTIPQKDSLYHSSLEQINALIKENKDSVALAVPFRYFEITGDELGLYRLKSKLRTSNDPLVKKNFSGLFQLSDYKTWLSIVEKEDRKLSAVVEYLMADSGMEYGWEINHSELLVSALKKDPLLTGAHLDLGRILNDSFQMPSGWKCMETAKKIAPKHSYLNIIYQLEKSLREDFPDHF